MNKKVLVEKTTKREKIIEEEGWYVPSLHNKYTKKDTIKTTQ